MQKVRLYLKLFGQVQGIGYRWFVVDEAKSFSIIGWVRNCHDRSVELEAQGTPTDLKNFEIAIKDGHSMAIIKKIETQKIPLLAGEKDFKIIY